MAASHRSKHEPKYGMALDRVAVLLGCSYSTIWRISKGRIEPRPDQAALLALLVALKRQKPKAPQRLNVRLVSSGRLAALSLLLKHGPQLGQMTK